MQLLDEPRRFHFDAERTSQIMQNMGHAEAYGPGHLRATACDVQRKIREASEHVQNRHHSPIIVELTGRQHELATTYAP